MDIPVADHPTSNEADASSSGVDALLSVSLQLNGQPYRAEIRALGHLARPAARPARPHRHQEGLRPRPVRRLHGAGRRQADQLVPDAGGDARTAPRSPPSRAWPSEAACTRCSRRSSSTTRSSAATARPGQICSAVGLIERRPRQDARRDPRADERQPLPLRRLHEHRRPRSSRCWTQRRRRTRDESVSTTPRAERRRRRGPRGSGGRADARSSPAAPTSST